VTRSIRTDERVAIVREMDCGAELAPAFPWLGRNLGGCDCRRSTRSGASGLILNAHYQASPQRGSHPYVGPETGAPWRQVEDVVNPDGTKTVDTNSGLSPIPRSLPAPPERHDASRVQLLCDNLYDARTHLAVPFMPVLRHLPRQEVKFSGTIDLPVASKRWAPDRGLGCGRNPRTSSERWKCRWLRLLGVATALAAEVA
jgi:hypothetical protein